MSELDVRHGEGHQRRRQQAGALAIQVPPDQENETDRAQVGQYRQHAPHDVDPPIVAIGAQLLCQRLPRWRQLGEPFAYRSERVSHQCMQVERKMPVGKVTDRAAALPIRYPEWIERGTPGIEKILQSSRPLDRGCHHRDPSLIWMGVLPTIPIQAIGAQQGSGDQDRRQQQACPMSSRYLHSLSPQMAQECRVLYHSGAPRATKNALVSRHARARVRCALHTACLAAPSAISPRDKGPSPRWQGPLCSKHGRPEPEI